MEVLIIILLVVIVLVWAYFFPKGIKIFGIPAETFFSKNKPEDDTSDKF